MHKRTCVVVCDNIRSTHNVGSIFRTADGAGVSKIYLCGITPYPPRPDIEKVSLGAEKNIPFELRKSTVRLVSGLKKKGYRIVVLENNIPGTVRYDRIRPNGPVALILGGEVGGVDSRVVDRADIKTHIPMRGAKESLNVSVAFGIVVYSLLK